MHRFGLFFLALLCAYEVPCEESQEAIELQDDPEDKITFEPPKPIELPPTVLVVLLIRNKAHTLPHFLALFERLKYPKDRMGLYIRSDHNEDDSLKIMETWIKKWNMKRVMGFHDTYHFIDSKLEESPPKRFEDELNPIGTTNMRFAHVMELKESGLNLARSTWSDRVWFLDADVFITNPNTLDIMARKSNFTVYAPLLKSVGKYSNFWGGMGEDYYYQRTESYEKILDRKHIGCHAVPLVHSSMLINLNLVPSEKLTFLPSQISSYDDGPFDDMISFAVSAHRINVSHYICNDNPIYGYVMTPLDGDQDSLSDDLSNLLNLKLEIIAYGSPLPYLKDFEEYVQPLPKKDSLGVEKVYLINLDRRVDRRHKMEAALDELGVEYERVSAVDGKREIDEDYIKKYGISMMPDFSEPYHQRPIKHGEIGCFMSHYNIWLDILEKGYENTIVLEDDIRFEPYFKEKISALHNELKRTNLDWDLIFLGRKILWSVTEPWVEGSDLLVHVNYTYWTLGYMLSQDGAKKLVEEMPLKKIVPVDEYLPIMYDKHPNLDWKGHYKHRNLKAFSVHPLYLFPTHYVGEPGHFSDTEDSNVMTGQQENDANIVRIETKAEQSHFSDEL